MNQSGFTIGEKVHYKGGKLPENGIVKSFSSDGIGIFVVFDCTDWENFAKYTANYCNPYQLEKGWYEEEDFDDTDNECSCCEGYGEIFDDLDLLEPHKEYDKWCYVYFVNFKTKKYDKFKLRKE